MKKLILFAALLLGSQTIQAQSVPVEVLSSASQDNDGPQITIGSFTGTISWTIGELIVGTESNSSNTVNQGYQLPASLQWTGMTSFHYAQPALFSLFPNPSAVAACLIAPANAGVKKVLVYTMDGKMVKELTVPSGTEKILLPTENLPAGIYQVQAWDAERQIGQSRLIKQ